MIELNIELKQISIIGLNTEFNRIWRIKLNIEFKQRLLDLL